MQPADDHFEEVLAAYLEAADAGWAPSRRAFLERYPQWRDRLEEFFAASDLVAGVSGPLQARKTPSPRPSSEPTVLLEGPGRETLPRPFGRYELSQLLGRGGMGVVYKARLLGADRVVALKMLQPASGAADDLQRFRNEADAAARMDHPNIVPIYEVGEHQGRPYFSMKLIDGGPLSDRAERYRDRPDEAALLIEKVARAVEHAHRRGILHRDLKPGNVLIDHTGEPLVSDFGLARRLEGDSDLTRTGAIVGTPCYMAPEQAQGRNDGLTTATDVYSLGAILYELLTGTPPFKADDALETLLMVRAQKPIAPRQRNPLVPRDLEAICLKCLEKDPTRRYPSAAELADDLRRYTMGEVGHARQPGVLERAVKWARRRPALAATTAVLALGLALGLTSLGALGLVSLGVAGTKGEATYVNVGAEVREQAEAARQSRAEAEAARRQAESALYASRLARAQLALLNNDPEQADQALAKCPEELRNWEWKYLRQLRQPATRVLKDSDAPVTAATISRDGRLATALANRTAGIWDPGTGERLLAFRNLPAAPSSVTFSPDGRFLACGVDNGVRLWDAATGKPVARLEGHTAEVRDISYAPGGKALATASGDGTVRLWDTATLRSRVVADPSGPVSCVAFSPDGRLLASAGSDRNVRLWDVQAAQPRRVLAGHTRPVLGVRFSPDGRWLASVSKDGTARLWTVQTGQLVHELRDQAGITAVAFSPDASRLAGGVGASVKLWDTRHGTEVLSLKGPGRRVVSVAFSAAGDQLICTTEDDKVRVWAVPQ